MIESLRHVLGSGSVGTKVAIGAAAVAGITFITAGAVMAAPGHHRTAVVTPSTTIHHAKANHANSQGDPDPVPTVTPTTEPSYTDDDQYGDDDQYVDDSASPTPQPSYGDDDDQGSSSNGGSHDGGDDD